MTDWKKYRLDDISESCLGKMLDKVKNKGELQPYLSNKCVRWGEFDLQYVAKMRFEPHEQERYGIKAGDLVICEGGEPGRCAIWKDQIPDMKIQKALHRVRVNKNFNNYFLYYRFLHAGRTGELDKYFIGTTIKHLTGTSLKRVEFKFPPFKVQNKIAKILSDLDAKIELNNRINAELEGMAKLIYDYWFVQFDFPISAAQAQAMGRPELEDKPYKKSSGKMVYNEELKREIPEGWEVSSFGRYANAKGGFAFKSDWWSRDGVPVIKIKDISENYIVNIESCSFVEIDKLKKAKGFQALPGDVVIAMTGATVGKYGIVPDIGKPILVNQRVAKFNLGSEPIKRLPFLINSLNQKYFRETIFIIAGGAAQPNISSDQIDNIPLLLPEPHILNNYNLRFSNLYSKIMCNIKQNQQLSSLRDWLLPMLMNGQVKVGEVSENLSVAAEPEVNYGG